MDQNLSEQEKFETLDREYRKYVENIRREWLLRNQVDSKRVYEVMYPYERAQVQEKIAAWGRYVTPLAEAWWKQRGYGVLWPEDDSKPIQVFKLETS